MKFKIYRDLIKPILDTLLALIFVLLFWWLYIIIAILVRTKLGSPVLFTQERPGKINPKTGQERIFKLCKFRTMTNAKDEAGNLLPDEVRLTKFGKFLRSTSMDELPEILFNILLSGGKDMSWVGPRPLLVKYLPLYSKEQRRRHEAVPGLTGYAQVYGKYNTTSYDKLKLDMIYVEKCSVLLDIQLILMTLRVIFTKDATEGVAEGATDANVRKNK